ncbi:ferritin-like domain-containing protein [Vicingaceae bacterium]|nr:ferritin-like domain-containing protein [Vicingaceae bacterium]
MKRERILKLIKFLNKRTVPALDAPQKDFASLMEVFKSILEHEIVVTASIYSIITACLQENDHLTNNFMQ